METTVALGLHYCTKSHPKWALLYQVREREGERGRAGGREGGRGKGKGREGEEKGEREGGRDGEGKRREEGRRAFHVHFARDILATQDFSIWTGQCV